MCGIFGVVARDERLLGELLVEAGRRLAYRGYDSVGCATVADDGTVDLRKDVGRVDDVNERLRLAELRGRRGMVQLRWATFGAPSHENAQPHLDSDGDLVGAHNGNIVNNVQLREAFLAEGMTVRGTNDGESCVHAVERYVDRGHPMEEAVRLATRDLEGDYAFVIGSIDDDTLYAVKQGSGLAAGLGDDATYISSDLPSLLPLTQRVVRLEDGEMVILRWDRVEIRRIEDGVPVERAPETVEWDVEAAQKGGHAHFMLKEIHEQPRRARDLLHYLEASTEVAGFLEEIRTARRLYLVGCGTSYHACLLGAASLNRLAGIPAVAALAPQFRETLAHTLSPRDVVVWVSQSGETKDVLSALKGARGTGARMLGVLNVIGSSLMHACDRYLPLVCGYETSVPATKTFLNQALLFMWLADRLRHGGTPIRWEGFPELIEETLRTTSAGVDTIADLLAPLAESYTLGYGLTLGIALEGALKLKEVTYIHCEGMLSSEFKHGPLSAVHEGYPVLFVCAPGDAPMVVSHVSEVTCRGGVAVAVAAPDALLAANVHHLIQLPQAEPEVTALLAVLPLQLASYQLSVRLGIDPDFPRNLSKTLTVD